MAALLSVDRLGRRVSPSFRLGPVSFEVQAGERIGVVGPSGSGKSTLLRLIAGVGPAPDSGEVRIDGASVHTLPRRARAASVGLMNQHHDLVDGLRVRHNVQAGLLGRWSLLRSALALFGPFEAPIAREALHRVALAQRYDDRTWDLSGGERQRVAVARLLVQAPRLMLADEPVSALDPVTAGDILSLLTRLVAEDGGALVCSLHQPELAIRFCDRILGLKEGAVVLDLPAGRVSSEHLSAVYGREAA